MHLEDRVTQGDSPGRGHLGTPLIGSSPFRQRRHSQLDVAPTITSAGSAAHFLNDNKANNRLNTVQIAATVIRSASSELHGLKLYIKGTLPGVTHDPYGVRCAMIRIYSHFRNNYKNFQSRAVEGDIRCSRMDR